MLLDENLIHQHLQQAGFQGSVLVHVLESIDSTNRYLKDLPESSIPTLCCAETQTQGRGRFQRAWFSPRAENIYCSIRWQFPNNLAALSPLSLVISLALLQTIRYFGIGAEISIKWPNDLLWQGRKLSGILLETTHHNESLSVIVGMGLNVNSDSSQYQADEAAPSRPWCSLYDITHQTWDRNSLLAQLFIHAQRYIDLFQNHGFAPFLPLWKESDYLYGKNITILQANQSIEGVAQGITAQGELLVLDAEQHQWCIACGEATITLPTNE